VIIVSRELLAVHLRTYGEDELAGRIVALDDRQMGAIGERAFVYASTGGVKLLAEAVTRATIEILEGAPRNPRWRRRRRKGIHPGY
jgi:hypothetical protein